LKPAQRDAGPAPIRQRGSATPPPARRRRNGHPPGGESCSARDRTRNVASTASTMSGAVTNRFLCRPSQRARPNRPDSRRARLPRRVARARPPTRQEIDRGAHHQLRPVWRVVACFQVCSDCSSRRAANEGEGGGTPSPWGQRPRGTGASACGDQIEEEATAGPRAARCSRLLCSLPGQARRGAS